MRSRILPRPLRFLLVAGLGLGACASAPQTPAPAPARVATLPPPDLDADASAATSKAPRPKVTERLPERKAPDDDFRQQPPKPGPEPKFEIPPVKRFKLSNGLPVILATDRSLPLVYVQMVVLTGGLADPTGQAGLAHLTADMLDEGTKSRSALQISEEIERLGASLSTDADWDYSTVSVSGLTEIMDRALPVWADVLLNPAFSDQELARVRENRLAGFQRRKDSPPALASITFGRAVYGENHPLGWPLDGTEETLPKLGVETLRGHHEAFFQPSNAVLVVAGDMDEAGVKALIEPLLASWKGRARKPRPVPAARPADKTRIFLVDKAQAPQSSLRVGLPALPRKHPDYYKARVMNEILGGSFRRLSLNLREQKGWTYGANSRFSPYKVPGPWQVSGEFVADRTADSVNEILSEIEKLRSEEVPAAELQEAKDALSRAFPASFATMRQVASQMAGLHLYNLPPNELETFQKKIEAVTAQDVKDMARKYLRPEKLTIVVVGDQAGNQAALSKIAPVELRDVDGRPTQP